MPGLNPLALEITWRGQNDTLDNLTAEATAGTTKVSAAGSVAHSEVRLSRLTFTRGDTTYLKLLAPASVRWGPAWQIEGLRLGGDGDLAAVLTLGKTGRVEFAMHRVQSTWFGELAPLPGPAWAVNSLVFTGAWDRGPMTFSVTGDAAIDLGGGRTAAVAVAAKGDTEGLRVETLRATEGPTTVFAATGRAPVVFSPGAVPSIRIAPDGALIVEASMGSNHAFWEKLAELTGIGFNEPHATAHVTGTWARPLGDIRVKAARVAMDKRRFERPLPAMESLDFVLTGDRNGLKLDTFSASVEGQAVRAQGRLPVEEGGWDNLRHDPLAFARAGAEVHLEVPDAALAAFTPFLPPYLAPQGRLQADLNYGPGGSMKGFLRLRDAASRPFGPLGELQEINADAQVTGRTVELRSVTAMEGGQPVSLSGSIQFRASAPRATMSRCAGKTCRSSVRRGCWCAEIWT